MRRSTLFMAVGLCGLIVPLAPAQVDDEVLPAALIELWEQGYLDYDLMVADGGEVIGESEGLASAETIAQTTGDRSVWAITLAAAGDVPPEDRQAILIVGGIDAEHPLGAQVAFDMIGELVGDALADPDSPAGQMLARRTIYILPRVNPDGVERFFNNVKHDARVNARPLDNDRDGVSDEDGPNDLNGDGLISVMRVADPNGQWMVDPDEPRLMKKADRDKDERGEFTLLIEGVDDDEDGQFNEDGPGGIDDDRNWPHLFESGRLEVGVHPLSEPQTRALADFVLAHKNITAAIVLGRHDNVVNVPKGDDRDPSGQAYRHLHPDDVKLYEFISGKYRDLSGLKDSAGSKPNGALYAWLYSQRGILTFAPALWGPPSDDEDDEEEEEEQQGEDEADEDAADDEPDDAPDVAGDDADGDELEPRQRSHPAARRYTLADADGLSAYVESNDRNKAWLRYSDDELDGAGFITWHTYNHAALGEVEIGGFAPYFFTTPPAVVVKDITGQQIEFLLQLSQLLADPHFGEPLVEQVGADVWRVKLILVNDGYFPTHPAIARHIRNPAFTIRPIVDRDRIVGGEPMQRIANIEGVGGSGSAEWLIRGDSGDNITIRAFDRSFGELTIDVILQPTADNQEDQ